MPRELSAADISALGRAKVLWNHSSVKDASPGADQARGYVVSDCGAAPGKAGRRFVVASVFKWGHRKGWDVLLEGFWRAFLDPKIGSSAAAGNVVLCLRTSKVPLKCQPPFVGHLHLPTILNQRAGVAPLQPSIGATGEVFESRAGGSSRSEGICGEIRAYARHFLATYRPRGGDEGSNLALRDLPSVEVLEEPLSRLALRRLVGPRLCPPPWHLVSYGAQPPNTAHCVWATPQMGAADAFALPSRGEGWGLPITEAMALEVMGNTNA